jgi:hypothetical protein
VIPGYVIAVAKFVGVPLLVIGGMLSSISVLKGRRRKKRRLRGSGAQRVAGGWREVIDNARDLSYVVPSSMTRQEQARLLPLETMGTLARTADAMIFGVAEPVNTEIESYWSEIEKVVRYLRGGVSRARRLRAMVRVSSLRKGGRDSS